MRHFLACLVLCLVATSTFPTDADASQPPTLLLAQLKGQTCSGTVKFGATLQDIADTIGEKNGQWAVHHLFKRHEDPGESWHAPMTDTGWRQAEVDSSTVSFSGKSASLTLTATGPHTAIYAWAHGSGEFTCSPAPPDQASPP